jgi:3-deoxy-D-manno-octulosonic-acid transferase
MIFVYNLIIHLYNFFIKIAALFNPKAKLWVDGRKNIFKEIQSKVTHQKPVAWFHCASLGEFEQGRPIIESYHEKFPDHQIFLTFFSPSGYEIRKNYPGAGYIFYLPLDTRANAKRFVKLVKPEFAVFIKYEFWFNYLRQLKKEQVPVIVVSAIFRPGQRFFRWWGRWQLKMLKSVTHFFVQDEVSKELLNGVGISQVTVGGDTRFDRVLQVVRQKKQFPLIEKFISGSKIVLAGSTWPPDEDIIIGFIRNAPPDTKFIFAPHEVHNERIKSLVQKFSVGVIRFSEADELNISGAKILIIDNIGILSHLYQYADIAYIGGGFGVGIHNILEAATFGNPVIFGPNYHKFREARELIKLGGAFSINSGEDFEGIIGKLITNEPLRLQSSEISKKYVETKQGATSKIINYIEERFHEK